MTQSQNVLLFAAIVDERLYFRPRMARIQATLPQDALLVTVHYLARCAFMLLDATTTAIALADMIEHVAGDIRSQTLVLLAADAKIGGQHLAMSLAVPMRIMSWWMKAQKPACDWNLPEVTAIYQGPEAMRAFVAGGGSFSGEADASQMTLAHHAAMASFEYAGSISTFIELGGTFHSMRDRFGRTPSHQLASNAGVPEAIHACVRAGGHLDNTPDNFGYTPLESARDRGPEFEAAYLENLALSGGTT